MALTDEEVRYVARLARLALAEDQLEEMGRQLNAVLGYVEQLSRLDTATVEPTWHVLPVHNVWRADVVEPSLPREQALAAAPRVQDGMFRVPRIVEGEES